MQTGFDNLHEKLQSIGTTTSNIETELREIQQKRENNDKIKILEWISQIPYSNHHTRISENRLKQTGEWILEKQEYRSWQSESVSKLLLLRGIRKLLFNL